jgi:D-arabinose 1-dehydrogenase-like Zn-dependent alcohol dehydrogenase
MRLRATARLCMALFVIVLFIASSSAASKNVKIHGYVTQVSSPTSFEIEDYRIASDRDLVLDFDNAGPDVKFAVQDLRVGVEVQIVGVLDESTGELRAKSMKVDRRGL